MNAKTDLSNVHDFDKDHPPFKLTFITENQQVERISQTEKERLIEQSGLIFPHSQHVGKVQGPNGMADVRDLTCTNCHHPKGKEMRFSPPTFERDCKTCHRKELKLGSAEKAIYAPHGSVQPVSYTHLDVYKRQTSSICKTRKNVSKLSQRFRWVG